MVNRWGNNGNNDRLYFFGSKITADGDCSHEIKRPLLLGRKAMTNLCVCLVTSVASDSLRHHGPWPARPLCPWDSPGKSTGVGCHYLLRESEKVGLKLNIQKTKIMASGAITSWEIDGETVETVSAYFLAPKSLQMVTAAMKLKDTYSLEGKLRPT